ncbi:hypothetical protein Tco_1401133 [Tanacetum coccineum]
MGLLNSSFRPSAVVAIHPETAKNNYFDAIVFLRDDLLANLPEAAYLQPCLEQLSVPIYYADVNAVVGETSLSFALLNVHNRAEGARKHAAALRRLMVDIVSHPLSSQNLLGEASTSAVAFCVDDLDTDEDLGSVVCMPQFEDLRFEILPSKLIPKASCYYLNCLELFLRSEVLQMPIFFSCRDDKLPYLEVLFNPLPASSIEPSFIPSSLDFYLLFQLTIWLGDVSAKAKHLADAQFLHTNLLNDFTELLSRWSDRPLPGSPNLQNNCCPHTNFLHMATGDGCDGLCLNPFSEIMDSNN